MMCHQSEIALVSGTEAEGAVNHYKDHVLSYFLSILKREDPQSLIHPCLEKIRTYDHRYGNHLYETLFTFLRNERSIADTARELDIHRSTLNHRLERISELFDLDLDDPKVRLTLLLSFYSGQSD